MVRRPLIDKRKLEEGVFLALMFLSTLLVVGTLILIVGTVSVKGLPALSLSMLTQTPKGGYYLGKEGGVLNAIIGSLYLSIGATGLALLLALPVALYLRVYVGNTSRLASLTRLSFDILWGIPSIVYGAFGFTVMVFFHLGSSLLAGIVTVALFTLPIMSRAMDETLKMVSTELEEASYALGATRLETALKVVARQALPGILTAVLIAFGRGIGDAASVLFTAGFSDSIPNSLFRPAATLPLAVFFQLGSPLPEVQARAYASALILTFLILLVSLLTRLASKRLTKHVVR